MTMWFERAEVLRDKSQISNLSQPPFGPCIVCSLKLTTGISASFA